jgi:Papain-like cysteine protease AvrRpt2
MQLILNTPPLVRQTYLTSCWAASFHSWCGAMGRSRSPNEASMMSMFEALRGALNSNGSARESGLRAVSHLGFMTARKVRGVSLTPAFFANTLREQGHIYLAYRPISPAQLSGHVVVVYGINESNQVLVMDPDPNSLFPCHMPIDWYMAKTDAIVCTSMLGRMNIANPFSEVGHS